MSNFKLATAEDIEKFKKIVGSNVQYYRAAKNLSQQDLADIVGIGTSCIGAIELGKSQPKMGTLLNIAIALGVEPRDIYAINREENIDFRLMQLEAKTKDAEKKIKEANERMGLIKSFEKNVTELNKIFKKK